ncbi:hypothetical protein HaLaN_00549 [Haematococcus lacustris]|uniref:Uncharacterized protein n=1 Tax=Haematococcus lacustris TaxID=44745 RepID=A0A699YGB5_HAELA|nr:hypothetical protein HaLaN_00549 [Haematococcus lacustris]
MGTRAFNWNRGQAYIAAHHCEQQQQDLELRRSLVASMNGQQRYAMPKLDLAAHVAALDQLQVARQVLAGACVLAFFTGHTSKVSSVHSSSSHTRLEEQMALLELEVERLSYVDCKAHVEKFIALACRATGA